MGELVRPMEREQPSAELATHLNGPMVEKLRKCAADYSPDWSGKITVYPPEARQLVELIDAVETGKPPNRRMHWVFIEPCGCAFGVMDAPESGEEAAAPQAWAAFYEGRVAAGFAAMERGVQARLVTHHEYEHAHMPQILGACPHRGGDHG